MSIGMYLLLMVIVGLVVMIATIGKRTYAQVALVQKAAEELFEALTSRYTTLLNLLGSFKKYVDPSYTKLQELIDLISDVLNTPYTKEDILKASENENSINKKLEDVKYEIEKYPNLYEDIEIQDLISEVINKESAVGEALNKYNLLFQQTEIFLSLFPISVIKSIVFIKWNYYPFVVNKVEEFGDNYIDEDEI